MIYLSEKANIEKFIYDTLQKHFDDKRISLRDRVKVVADVEKWKPVQVDIWQQKRGNNKSYSVYFDYEFVCRCDSQTSPKKLEVLFLKGLLEAFEHNRIYFDPREYEEETELAKEVINQKKIAKDEKDKEIKKMDADPIVKQVLTEINQEDYDKNKKKVSQKDIIKIKEEI